MCLYNKHNLNVAKFVAKDGNRYELQSVYFTKDKSGKTSLEFRTLFSQEMIKNEVLIPWIALSYSHGEKELELTLNAVKKSLHVYKQALEHGIEKYLKGRAIRPVFRKFN